MKKGENEATHSITYLLKVCGDYGLQSAGNERVRAFTHE